MEDMSDPRLRILLVDDDEDEYILTQAMLADRSFRSSDMGQAAYELEWVSTFADALEAIERNTYDVFLVDYHLGDRDGLDLLREVVSRGYTTPIILMTGQGSYAVDLEAMREGATDYLVKDEITPTLLERTIRYAIERKRTEDEIRKKAMQAGLLATLSQEFARASMAYPDVLHTIARRIGDATGDACVISLVASDQGEWLEPAAVYHSDAQMLESLSRLLTATHQPLHRGASGKVLSTGQALLIPQVNAYTAGEGQAADITWPANYPVRSMLIVPLRSHGSLMGTLAVARVQSHDSYNADDQLFFQDLADRAALAIENARLYATEARRVRELDALHTATSTLLTTIELEPLLARILDAAQNAISAADRGTLHLIAMDTGHLQIRATSGFSDPRIKKVSFSWISAYAIKAVRDKTPMLVPDMLGESEATIPSSGTLRPVRSLILAPLVLGGDVLGVLSLSSVRPNAFNPNDLRLLVSLATTTTAAVHNAQLHAEVQKLAITDSVTDLYNRRGFIEVGKREVERARRFGRPLSVIMIDIDHFKEVNDTYGHAAGDQTLRILSERFRTSIRDVDILARYGGDEFAILLPETDLTTACAIAERVRARIEEPLSLVVSVSENNSDLGTVSFYITASLGVSDVLVDTQDLSSLLERADAAAYLAKRGGRNRVEPG